MASASKRPRRGAKKESPPAEEVGINLLKQFEQNRLTAGKSVMDFKFLKTRVKLLSNTDLVKKDSNGILYWMFRDCRVQDNWAFLFSQKLSLKNQVPLIVCFCLLPKFLDATIRQYKFLTKGLEEIESDCQKLNISFVLFTGDGPTNIPDFVKEHNIGAVVCDMSPLRFPKQWVKEVGEALPDDVAYIQVDSHNIVPVWEASDKQEYAARTIRNKINSKLSTYLTEFPSLIKHPFDCKIKFEKCNWKNAYNHVIVDQSVGEVDWAVPGYKGAVRELENFISLRLKNYEEKRNDPLEEAISNLSPWFHFGQISVQRCILAVNQYQKTAKKSVEAFCEEAIIRRELSDNYCFYNDNYDSLEGAPEWARKTLDDHRQDKREYIYMREEFAEGKTHDQLWNAAQLQLSREGKMHGYLRMYWAKKILEWTATPEEALATSIYLNDRFSLDGRDPNGYVGCLWSICGLHDQGWKEREVFGKIRYMAYTGCRRKFDVDSFIARYGLIHK